MFVCLFVLASLLLYAAVNGFDSEPNQPNSLDFPSPPLLDSPFRAAPSPRSTFPKSKTRSWPPPAALSLAHMHSVLLLLLGCCGAASRRPPRALCRRP